MIVTIAGSVVTVEPTDDELSGLSIGLAAFDGEVGNGTFPVNDASNALTAVTGRQLMVEEGSTVLSDGFMLDQDRTRTTEPQGRLYGFGLLDANALLDGFRITRDRPSETDVARVLAFAAIDGPAWDTSMVLVAETVTMPKKRYDSDGGWTSELIPDVVSYTGKTLFLHDLADGSGRCLHYHNLLSGHACGLSISDVPAAVDHVTVWEPWEPARNRTSVDLRNDVLGRDQAGRSSTATDATSIAAHDADGLQHQVLLDVEATSQTDVDVQTSAFLASQKSDLDTWTCSIGPLDEDALALIRVGDIIEVTSAVMGLTASDQRIAHMTLTPAMGTNGTAVPDLWMADLEMGAPIRRRRRKKPVPFTDDPWVCIPQDYTVLTGAGNNQMFCVIGSGNSCESDDTSGSGNVLYTGCTYRVEYRVFHSPTSTNMTAMLFSIVGSLSSEAEVGMGGNCGFVPPPQTYGVIDYSPPITTEFFARLFGIDGFGCMDSSPSSISTTITYLSGPDPRFEDLPLCSNGEPRTGQLVRYRDVDGDGTTLDFETAYGYVPYSLHVTVNGLDWTAQLTETDPSAGEYSLLYPVPLGATVLIEFRRAS